ncbi:MAG: hypothetical protein ACE5JU_03085 [Candidatus Binatia bacterium]
MAKERVVPRRKRGFAGARARRKIQTLLPVSFRSHLKASVREGLLAFESLFDDAVKALEKQGRKEPGRRGRKIKVG